MSGDDDDAATARRDIGIAAATRGMIAAGP
jgi:hypothetical protein